MNCRLPEDTYWVLLIFASQWLTWCSKSSQSPYFYKFPRWFLCMLNFRKYGLDSRAASVRRHVLFCTSLWGSRVMLTLLVCRPCFQEQQGSTAGEAGKLQPAGRIQTVTGFCLKKKKKVLSERMNAAKFLRLHSIFDCLWTTTQSWIAAAEMYGLQSFPIWLSTEKVFWCRWLSFKVT